MKYWPEFEKTVREFVAQANKAAELENKLRQLKDEAQAEADSVRISIFFTPLPPLIPVLLAREGDLPEYGPLARFIADLKAHGIAV